MAGRHFEEQIKNILFPNMSSLKVFNEVFTKK